MDIQDVTNYLSVGNRRLRPGFRLSSSCYDINGQQQSLTSTTAEALLRNGPIVRITCALHGWLNSNEVYHHRPPSGEMIGIIKKRYNKQEIALIDLHHSFRFTDSSSHVDAIQPKRLLTSEDIEKNNRGR